MSAPRPRRILRRLAAVLVGSILALSLAEVVVRVADVERRWLPDLAYYQGVDVDIHRASTNPDLVYELRPDIERSIAADHAEFAEEETTWWSDPRVIEINSLGHRGPARTVSKEPGSFRIIALGGSNTFGAAVSNGESWPGALERALQNKTERKVEVWNFGVNGYVTSQKVAQARDALSRFEPDLLIFQIYNTGPRNILLSDDVDVVQTFREDPRLYRETLLWSPPESQGIRTWLWSISHLYRSVVIGLNRRARVDDQGKYGAPHQELDDRSETHAERQFRAFVAEDAGEVPVWILYGAEGPGPAWCDDVGVPVIPLAQESDIPDLPGARHIHPGAAVYSWYGQKIADRVVSEGCLDGGC